MEFRVKECTLCFSIGSLPNMFKIIIVYVFFSSITFAHGDAQVDALLDFKSAIEDRLGRLSSWNKSTKLAPCDWEGISCINSGVSEINLSTKNLSGTIRTDAICKELHNLTVFNLHENSFSGEFPLSILNCRSLVRLDIGENFIAGELPNNISALSKLEYLDLTNGLYTGTVPAGLGELSELHVLVLWNCRLHGPFPKEIGKLSKLTHLSLSYNEFGPVLPEELGNLTELQWFSSAGCGLSGPIPKWIGKLKKLYFLELTYNSLSGSIPIEICQLPNLVFLELYNNALSGPIPREIGNLTYLTDLDLSNNMLTGSIPEELMKIPNLGLIHLWNNSLTGKLPRGISQLTALFDLALFQNHLTGELPPDLGSKCSLRIFDVSSNNFSGKIPANLCNGGRLWRMILFGNSFTGGIPSEYGSCESLIRVRMQGNSLTGVVPSGLWGKPNMIILDISGNRLEGHIAENLGLSLQLNTLKVDGNRLEGELPRSVGRLTNLNQFIASGNLLSGRIPPEVGHCSELTNLFLDNNRFRGDIPPEIGQLQKLQYLNLAKNSLSGSIPREIGELFNLISLDLSMNELSGGIPRELSKLHLSEFIHFNVSYNQLTGVVPFDINNQVFGSSFIGNPGLCTGSSCSTGLSDEKKGRSGVVAWVAGVVLAFAALVSFAASCWLYRKYRALTGKEGTAGLSEGVWSVTPFQKLGFSQEEILASIDEDNVIGSGGSGKVYRASLGNGQSVAVKKLWSDQKTSDYGFQAEVESLGRIRHVNIVRLLCVYSNGQTNLLVYDYMPNGSLGDLLHSTKGSVLDWPTRYRIALGAAQGLSYLHHDCVPQILHRDVKSNNILLTEDYDGMLADFGLARLRDESGDDWYSVSTLTGSLGYIAPEYAHKLKVNEKSDIYSYGVVLLELLTGRRPVDEQFGEEGTDIVRWVCGKIQSRDDVMKVFDPRIVGATPRDLMLVLKIALHCTSEVPSNRPSMREVVRMLKEASPSDEDINKSKDFKDSRFNSVTY